MLSVNVKMEGQIGPAGTGSCSGAVSPIGIPSGSNSPAGILPFSSFAPGFTQHSMEHLTMLGDSLWAQRLALDSTDLSILCAGIELKQAHRMVVICAAPDLAALLKPDLSKPGQLCLEIRNAQPATVEAMIHFLYTGSLPSGTDVVAVLRLAHQHHIDRLTAHCATLLADGLTPENAIEVGGALLSCRSNDVARRVYERAVKLTAQGHLRSRPADANVPRSSSPAVSTDPYASLAHLPTAELR